MSPVIIAAAALAGCIVTDGYTIRCNGERIRLLGVDVPDDPGNSRCRFNVQARRNLRPAAGRHKQGIAAKDHGRVSIYRVRGYRFISCAASRRRCAPSYSNPMPTPSPRACNAHSRASRRCLRIARMASRSLPSSASQVGWGTAIFRNFDGLAGAALRITCVHRIDELDRFPTLLALTLRRVAHDRAAEERFQADGCQAMRRLANALVLEDASYTFTSHPADPGISSSRSGTGVMGSAASCRSISTTPRLAGRCPCCCGRARRLLERKRQGTSDA